MKNFEDLRKLEKERQAFEEELDMQILSSGFSGNQFQIPYQNTYKKFMNSLLLSVIIFSIIAVGGWLYTKNRFETLSEENMNKIHRAIQYSVLEYYQDNKRYPVDIHGNIDFNLLKKRGYLNINVEEYYSKFKFDSQYHVIRTE